MAATTVVAGGTVLTVDAAGTVIADGAVAVRDGRITAVGPRPQVLADAGPDATVVDASGAAVLPGFVNGHTHGCMTYGRTIGADREFTEWFGSTQLPIMEAMAAEDYVLAETLCLVENLLEGTTTVLENGFFPTAARRPASGLVAAAAARTGARTVIADAYLSVGGVPSMHESPEEVEERHRAVVAEHHRRGRTYVTLSPLLPWETTVEQLAAVSALAREQGLMVHAHCAETPVYNQRSRDVHGVRTNVDLHARADCLGPWVQLVGCSEIDEGDVEAIAEAGARVISVPTSDLFQSHLPAPVPALVARGVPVSVASNGCAGNGGQSMLAALKDGAGLAKALTREPTTLDRHRALRMATIDAADNLGLADEVGSLEVGKRADVTVVDLGGPHVSPVLDVTAAVAYSARGSDVRHVLVDGEHLVADGRFTRFDVADLVAEVTARARHLAATHPPVAALCRGLP